MGREGRGESAVCVFDDKTFCDSIFARRESKTSLLFVFAVNTLFFGEPVSQIFITRVNKSKFFFSKTSFPIFFSQLVHEVSSFLNCCVYALIVSFLSLSSGNVFFCDD